MMDQEVFSLEDDDYGNMFITQETNNSENLVNKLDKSYDEDRVFLGVNESDFAMPCLSIVKPVLNAMYSDISDDEDIDDFQIPSSQKRYLYSL